MVTSKSSVRTLHVNDVFGEFCDKVTNYVCDAVSCNDGNVRHVTVLGLDTQSGLNSHYFTLTCKR